MRLRLLARRMGYRAVVAGACLMFAAAALAMVHVAIVLALASQLGLVQATLILAAADLLIAALLALLAARDHPGPAEREAALLRESAWRGLRQQVVLAGLVTTLTNLLRRR
ncbi:hypothetical protein [Limobrevibacterium gyesilva]|uniref:Uncharacterized protein n=1 Tax=Limobrevibacterium gyesilva TaxID=2991712 RepID=A0AA42CFQ8_9PROT|nr:hypothetical protein [Limobrevibacterium gyesilva]MCW3473030.1 hypothetical protein [Limobrevibacterium gyesilva]